MPLKSVASGQLMLCFNVPLERPLTRDSMNQFRDLLVIILFSLVFRAVLTLAFWSLGFQAEYAYYFRLANSLFFYMLLLLISITQLRMNTEDLRRVLGPPVKAKQINFAIAAALTYFVLENGEQAIEVLLVSNVNLDFAYQWWDFSEVPVNPPEPFSLRVLLMS